MNQIKQTINKIKTSKPTQFLQNLLIKCKYRSRQILPPCITWSTVMLLEIVVIMIVLELNIKVVTKMHNIETIYYEETSLPTSFAVDYPSIPYLAYNASNQRYHYNDSTFDYSSSISFFISILYTNYLHTQVRLEDNNYVLVHTNQLHKYIDSEFEGDCELQGTKEEDYKFYKKCQYYKQFGPYNALALDIMSYKKRPQFVSILPNIDMTLNSSNEAIQRDSVPVYLNVTENATYYKINQIKQALIDTGAPLIANFGEYKRCKNLGTVEGEAIGCTNQVDKDGKYSVGDIQNHYGKVSSSVIVGWNEEGFIVRGDELGHSKDYYLGKISATEDMYLCGNTYSIRHWISYSHEFQEFKPTVLKYKSNKRLDNETDLDLDPKKEYVVLADGMKVKIKYEKEGDKRGSLTFIEYNNSQAVNGTEVRIDGWEEMFESLFYPANQPHGVLQLEQCFYNLLPYEVLFDIHSHSVDEYGIIGAKTYNINFLNDTLPQYCYSTYNTVLIDGAYIIITEDPDEIKPHEPIPESGDPN